MGRKAAAGEPGSGAPVFALLLAAAGLLPWVPTSTVEPLRDGLLEVLQPGVAVTRWVERRSREWTHSAISAIPPRESLKRNGSPAPTSPPSRNDGLAQSGTQRR